MPDPTSAPATPAGSPSANPAAAATPEQTSASVPASPAADSTFGFTAEDFNHPVTGVKLKAWQKGWEETAKRAKEYESKLAQVEPSVKAMERLEALLASFPKLRQSILDAHEGKYSEGGTTGSPAPEETEEQRQRRELAEEIESKVSTDMGFNMFVMGLGKGDMEAGQKLFAEHRPRLNEVLNTMLKGTPHQRLMLAWKMISAPSASAGSPPPPPPPPSGATGSEPGAGTPESAGELDWSKLTEDQQFAQTMRNAGFSNLGAYMEAVGGFGR